LLQVIEMLLTLNLS